MFENCMLFWSLFRRSLRSTVSEEYVMLPSMSVCQSQFSYELGNLHDHDATVTLLSLIFLLLFLLLFLILLFLPCY